MLTDRSNEPSRRWPNLIVRLGVFLLIISVIIIILLSNLYLTQNYSQVKRSEAERELSLYKSVISCSSLGTKSISSASK